MSDYELNRIATHLYEIKWVLKEQFQIKIIIFFFICLIGLFVLAGHAYK